MENDTKMEQPKISIDVLEQYLYERYGGWGKEEGLFLKLVEELGEVAEIINMRCGRKQAREEDLQAELGVGLGKDECNEDENNDYDKSNNSCPGEITLGFNRSGVFLGGVVLLRSFTFVIVTAVVVSRFSLTGSLAFVFAFGCTCIGNVRGIGNVGNVAGFNNCARFSNTAFAFCKNRKGNYSSEYDDKNDRENTKKILFHVHPPNYLLSL